MSHTKAIFTDVVKDVIGNEPVLDQFDISYEAQFYGSMSDDYITGSMLSRLGSVTKRSASGKDISVPVFATGSIPRGKRFSKYLADSEPALSSDFTSPDVSHVPRLSYRLTPWHNRISRTAYRISQHYDSDERVYDTCLPDFAAALKNNGSQLWSTSGSTDALALSPYANVATGSVGYLYFNGVKFDRTAEGFETDPTVENDWTWSYPYESKYNPEQRVVKTAKSLGLDESYLRSTWGRDIIPVLTPLTKSEPIERFFPVLPGHMDPKLISSQGGRNSLRSPYWASGTYGRLIFFPAEQSNSAYDEVYGQSLLIPGDVDLSHLQSHNYLNPVVPAIVKPDPAPVTGTMSLDDTVKFLYGFGDLNNMAWSTRLFNSGTKSGSTFNDEIYTAPTGTVPGTGSKIPAEISPFSLPNLSAKWLPLPAAWLPGLGTFDWYLACRQGNFVDVNGVVDGTQKTYNWISASSGAGTIPDSIGGFTSTNAQGLFWEGDGHDSIVMSTYPDRASILWPSPLGPVLFSSLSILEVTSSLPWKLLYDRGVAAGGADVFGFIDFTFLSVYFAGIPGYPSHLNGGYGVEALIDFVSGSSNSLTGHVIGKMNQYDSMINGKEINPWLSYPIPPGEYRIIFYGYRSTTYLPYGTPGVTTTPHISAVSNVEIQQFTSFPPDTSYPKIGGNNYPEFKAYKVDPRYNPIYGYLHPGSSPTQVTGSQDNYRAEIFGVSPVIRGWKYGLYNGFPTNTKAVFRRDRFGQMRDMLEQRPFTKYVSVGTSPADNDAITQDLFSRENDSILNAVNRVDRISPSPVEVNFVRQRYKKDDRGIGYIFNEKVDPTLTISQNLSVEATSSLPYFDGVARHRQETDLLAVKDLTTTSLTIDGTKITVT